MRSLRFLLSLAIAVSALILPTLQAHADTYQLFNLGIDSIPFYGMSSTGQVVFDPSSSACSSGICYYSYLNGVSEGVSSTAPTFTIDDGSTCTPSVPGWSIFRGACNNGHQAFTGYFGSGTTGVYTVSGSVITKLPYSQTQLGGSAIWINSTGDIIFDDGFSDDWYEAVDLTTMATPEPSSLLLLFTGALGMGALAMRRSKAHATPVL